MDIMLILKIYVIIAAIVTYLFAICDYKKLLFNDLYFVVNKDNLYYTYVLDIRNSMVLADIWLKYIWFSIIVTYFIFPFRFITSYWNLKWRYKDRLEKQQKFNKQFPEYYNENKDLTKFRNKILFFLVNVGLVYEYKNGEKVI